jgi:hypothetical protein
MGLFDSLAHVNLFGKKGQSISDALRDGKLDINDIRDVATEQADTNNDGKLDLEDLDVNRDGKTDLGDLETVKRTLPFKK